MRKLKEDLNKTIADSQFAMWNYFMVLDNRIYNRTLAFALYTHLDVVRWSTVEQ